MNKKYALNSDHLDRLKKEIDEAENVLLFLDYDGTLAPFQVDPLSAFPLPEIEKMLNKLEKNKKFKLSLVSGRKISELKKMIDLKCSHYAGSHGLEIELSFAEGIIYPHQNNNIDVLSKKNYQKSREKYLEAEAVRVEDKGFGLALHFDSAEKQREEEKELKALFENTAYQILSGRKVIEIRPEGWNKGQAVNYITNQIRESLDIDNLLRIYIGDDRTDEDAFKVLNDGISIYVQNEDSLETEAEYYLKDPEDTAKFIAAVAGN